MHRSQFGKASWMFFGGAIIWCIWILLVTSGGGPSMDYQQALNVCGIVPIALTLTIAGILCGAIGCFRSRLGQATCSAAIAANVMFLIVLLLYNYE